MPWPYHIVAHQLLVLQTKIAESKEKMQYILPHGHKSDVTPSVLLREHDGPDGSLIAVLL